MCIVGLGTGPYSGVDLNVLWGNYSRMLQVDKGKYGGDPVPSWSFGNRNLIKYHMGVYNIRDPFLGVPVEGLTHFEPSINY